MKIAALVVAAGSGTRAGAGLPKQYRPLAGQTVLHHTISALLASDRIDSVTCVINEGFLDEYRMSVEDISDPRLSKPVLGQTKSRTESVQLGLNQVNSDIILVHDGARPLLPLDALDRLLDQMQTSRAAYLAVPVADALWIADDGKAKTPLSRDKLWRAQTPQAFHTDALKKAFDNSCLDANDDVELAVQSGLPVNIVLGSEKNIKITRAEDFELAEALLRDKMDIRTGQGYDVHAFSDGDHVTLCGIAVPYTKGFLAHSDGDVAMHAITDAIFGALAEGDIGQWFPPSDDQWKDSASDTFLAKACQRVAERGFKISNIDCTIICEAPKIGPHAIKMRERLAEITGINVDRISVKATTSERLGFTGREEGIASLATVTLVTL